MRGALTLSLIAFACAPALADGPDVATRYRRALADAEQVLTKGHLRGPGTHRLLRAIALDPRRGEGLRALARIWPDRAELLLQLAWQADPGDAATRALLSRDGAKPPAVLRFGKATRLRAIALISSLSAADQGRGPTIAVGESVPLAAIAAVGLDADGALVPTDLAFEAGSGLAIERGQLVGKAPRAAATLRVRDRKSQAETTLRIAVIGPVTRVELDPTAREVGPGEQLHAIAQLYDAAGNRVYRARLLWHITSERARLVLKHRHSRLADLFADQYHQNSILQRPERAVAEPTPIVVRVIEPESGVIAKLPITLTPRAAVQLKSLGELRWRPRNADTLRLAAKSGKPVMMLMHAEW